MIQNTAFQRKVLYLAVIALLLLPLYMIGNPAKGDPNNPQSRPGGKLAQLRAEYDLSQAELGEIDPTSASMNLATLGLKGVAAAILWGQANEYKKTENWEALIAVINQMSKLQPHFISVWEFQSHNLSYNISVEHDDFRFRYLWVKKGIDFLIGGTRYNRREPRLFWTVGWYMGQKFGISDEHRQFRQLFGDDGDFHESLGAYVPIDAESRGANGKPDNWLASKLWYSDAYELAEQGASLRGKGEHLFYADRPKAQMNYAKAIESEGYLDEKAEYAWRRGLEEWIEFGQRLVRTSWGENIRLIEREGKLEEIAQIEAQLDDLLPGVRAEIIAEKRATLTEDVLAALDKGNQDVKSLENNEEFTKWRRGVVVTTTTNREVSDRAPANVRAKAHQLASRAATTQLTADRIENYRTQVNYEYWRTRCHVEQLEDAVKARRLVFSAKEKMNGASLDKAREDFEDAWNLWAGILEEYPALAHDLMEKELDEDLERYVYLLRQLDADMPTDFKLRTVLDSVRPPPRASEDGSAGEASSDEGAKDEAAAASAEQAAPNEKSRPAEEATSDKEAEQAEAESESTEKSTADDSSKNSDNSQR